jgi:hypothetical protein
MTNGIEEVELVSVGELVGLARREEVQPAIVVDGEAIERQPFLEDQFLH